VHGIVLVELGVLLDLSHHDDDGRHAIEDLVAGAFVVLPGRDEMVDALLEELSVDLDVRHLDFWREEARRCEMADGCKVVVVGGLTMALLMVGGRKGCRWPAEKSAELKPGNSAEGVTDAKKVGPSW
jgi:hypothetical protein